MTHFLMNWHLYVMAASIIAITVLSYNKRIKKGTQPTHLHVTERGGESIVYIGD